jgi:DnaJ-class molecular chaperone
VNIDESLKLFGLTHGATLNEVKKAYRVSAKKNHPDRFIDKEQKKKQEKIMIQIAEAYKILVSDFTGKGKEKKPDASDKKPTKKEESDYLLYKNGLDYYTTYFHIFFQLFSKRTLKTAEEKEICLTKARACFIQLLREYPSSPWVSDAQDKLAKIEKALKIVNQKV